MAQINELQDSIKGKGQLLYLSKRIKHKDVSLFIHTNDPGDLGDFIADRLNRIEDITDIWVINMIKPVFFPLPKDTKGKKRFTITLKVFPKKLREVYLNIASTTLPEGLKMAYIAYTFHIFGDSIQFSILADSEKELKEYIEDKINTMPGVIKTTINEIERTRPLVSYDEWKQYSSNHGLVPSWDEELMINQFQE
jgi:hypothetical protein